MNIFNMSFLLMIIFCFVCLMIYFILDFFNKYVDKLKNENS